MQNFSQRMCAFRPFKFRMGRNVPSFLAARKLWEQNPGVSPGLTISTACFENKDAISSRSKVAFMGSDGSAVSNTWRVRGGCLVKEMRYPEDIVFLTHGLASISPTEG